MSADRAPECVARWPGCEVGEYDPRCCRFPKSCLCWRGENVAGSSDDAAWYRPFPSAADVLRYLGDGTEDLTEREGDVALAAMNAFDALLQRRAVVPLAPALLVNPITAVVHRPSCVHAAASIPWEGFARASSDRPCKVCAPEVPEPESEDA